MKATIVPNRNMIMIALAAAYAQVEGYDTLLIGAHAGDFAVYPDCRPEFFDALRPSLKLATGVSLEAPFAHFSKADIVAAGAKLDVPFHLTWSCYEGKRYHCGQCGTCTERRWAFEKAGIADPTRYRSA
jgi:7-cyano-7-deazaguanine synthase